MQFPHELPDKSGTVPCGFTDSLDQRAADVIRPDIFHTCGLYENKKIAAMAEARHIPVSFHNPSGPISNAAILQLASTVPNFLIHEIMLTDGSFRKRITNERVTFEDGYILIRNLRHYTGNVTGIRPKGDCVYCFEGLEGHTF